MTPFAGRSAGAARKLAVILEIASAIWRACAAVTSTPCISFGFPASEPTPAFNRFSHSVENGLLTGGGGAGLSLRGWSWFIVESILIKKLGWVHPFLVARSICLVSSEAIEDFGQRCSLSRSDESRKGGRPGNPVDDRRPKLHVELDPAHGLRRDRSWLARNKHTGAKRRGGRVNFFSAVFFIREGGRVRRFVRGHFRRRGSFITLTLAVFCSPALRCKIDNGTSIHVGVDRFDGRN